MIRDLLCQLGIGWELPDLHPPSPPFFSARCSRRMAKCGSSLDRALPPHCRSQRWRCEREEMFHFALKLHECLSVWLSSPRLRQRLQTPGFYDEPISPSAPKRALWSSGDTAAMGPSSTGEQFKAGLHHPRRSIKLKELPTAPPKALLF